MRVISGIYKRRRFDVPHSFKARPTTDFAKENLFNVLSNYMDFEDGIRALDLFAGTGSISIELVSRGCDQVISVEKDRDHYAFICKIMQELKTDKCLPIRGDVFKYLKSGREQFDFIFADPPYELAGLETLPDLIFENNLLKEDGLFVLEHGKKNSFEEHPHFVERRVYGSVNFTIFKLMNEEWYDMNTLQEILHSSFFIITAAPSAAPHSLQPYDTRGASPSSSGILVRSRAGLEGRFRASEALFLCHR